MTTSKKINSNVDPRISLFFLKIYFWTALLLVGLSLKIAIDQSLDMLSRLTINYDLIQSFDSLTISFILLLFCIVIIVYVLRYLIWIPWKIYLKVWDYTGGEKSKLNLSLVDVKLGLKRIKKKDIILTLIYLIYEFFIIYYIFSSFDKPAFLFVLLLALPGIDLILLLLTFFGYLIVSVFDEALKYFVPERSSSLSEDFKKATKGISPKYFLLADAADIFFVGLSLCFLYNFEENIFQLASRLNSLNHLQLLDFYLYLAVFLFLSSAIIIWKHRHAIKNIFFFYTNISSVKFNELINNYELKGDITLPIEYVKHEAEFNGAIYVVDERTYIPTKETENLISVAINIINSNGIKNILDVGTGCGNIALSVGKENPELIINAIDISYDALKVAKINKEIHKCSNVNFHHSNLLVNYKPKSPPDLIIANLPWGSKKYILKSNTPLRLFSMPALSIFPKDKTGVIGYYVDLIKQIKKKNYNCTLIFETGVLPKHIVEDELNNNLDFLIQGEYIPFQDYSVYKIIFE